MAREVKVTIDPDGTTKVEVKGVSGPACLDLTRNIEGALLSQQKTPEYHEIAQEQPQLTQRQGE